MKKTLLLLALASVHGPVAAEQKASGTARRSACQSVMLTHYCQRLTHSLRRAVAGKGEAMREIGEFYQKGEGLPRNAARAKEWYEKAVAAGDKSSYLRLGRIHEYGGPGLASDYASAKSWYEKAIAAGDSEGYWSMGWLYQEGGPGLKKNYANAQEWYEKAVAAGADYAYPYIARLYEEGGPGLEKDWARACSFYKKDGWGPDAQRVCPKN